MQTIQYVTPQTCPSCQFDNPFAFKFCGNCGNRLPSGEPTAIHVSTPPEKADRRQITVLFCDLVSSTRISQLLDPEDLNTVLQLYRARCARVIERFGGYVARYVGDGILAYFGYPHAHEDDVERALHVGLGILKELAQLDTMTLSTPVRLAVRIAIDTGPVVTGDHVREGDISKTLAVGQTPNRAARLQSLAKINSVLISDSTRRLSGDLFEYRSLGQHTLKGFSEPVQIWQVLRAKIVETRFHAFRGANLTPAVDRQTELAQLLDLWQQAQRGQGSSVLIAGEAGIGKSRLIDLFCERIAHQTHLRLYYQCASYYTHSPLYPVIERLRRDARFETEDSDEQRLDKLETLLARLTDRVEETMPLIAELLEIPSGNRYQSASTSSERRKQLTLDTLADFAFGVTSFRPTLILVEDLHWIDPTTLELLGRVIDLAPRLRLLVIASFRPEFQPPWPHRSDISRIELRRLNEQCSRTMIEHLLPEPTRHPNLMQRIIEQTDGIPLFIEEFTRTLLSTPDSAAKPPASLLPASLRDSLTARLDHLGNAKTVAQIGGALGRDFSHELLAIVTPLGERELESALQQLLAAQLLYKQGEGTQAMYSFRHALLQEAAYQSMLHRQRRHLHVRIANALVECFPQTALRHPEIIAHHFSAAGRTEAAVAYWLQAGRQAIAHLAPIEAIRHFRQGLQLLTELPTDAVHQRRKLELLLALGPALIAVEGPGTDAVADVYRRALSLCQLLPESQLHFIAYWGDWRINENFIDKLARAKKLLQLAESLNEPGLQLQGHHCLWSSLLYRGRAQQACVHIEQGLQLYAQGDYRTHAALYGGYDPQVCALGEAAIALWLRGLPEQARSYSQAALQAAESLSQPATLAHALDRVLVFQYLLGDLEQIHRHAETLISVGNVYSFPEKRSKGLLFRGWYQVQTEQREAGLSAMCSALTQQQAIATPEDIPIFRDMLAQAYAACGDPRQALHIIDLTLSETETSGLCYWNAELIRCQGRLLAELGKTRQALKKLETAWQQASAQQLLLPALRALLEWTRLSPSPQQRQRLQNCYDLFSEGFEEADLCAARALLNRI